MKRVACKRLLFSLFLDLLILGIALCVFALFHHVLPRQKGLFYGSSSAEKKTDFSQSFPEKFLPQGQVEETDGFYRDDSICLTLKTHVQDGVTFYTADLYVKDVTQIKTAMAGGSFATGVADSVLQMATDSNALLAVSGDYFGIRQRGVVIRNGKVYRKSVAHDVCVLYYDGTMETYAYADFDVEKAISGGAWQAWDFGPELLDKNGQAIFEFHPGIAGENPRIGMGYYEPGHYVLVCVDGRQSHSRGMTLPEFALLFENLGCKKAYNLDGGHSAVMTYKEEIYSSPSKKGGRDISDIIFLSPPSYQNTQKEKK